MIELVRTTLVLDDALLRRAKEHAARRGLTLSAVVERALRDHLRGPARVPAAPFRMPTFGGGRAVHDHAPGELADALLADDEASLARRGTP